MSIFTFCNTLNFKQFLSQIWNFEDDNFRIEKNAHKLREKGNPVLRLSSKWAKFR